MATERYIAVWVVDGIRWTVPSQKKITHGSLALAVRALERRAKRMSVDTRGLIYAAGQDTATADPLYTIAL